MDVLIVADMEGSPASTPVAIFRASQVSREYRQLAKLLPAGHNSRLRAAQRRAGSLLATPVMRAKERRWLDRSPAPDREPVHPPATTA